MATNSDRPRLVGAPAFRDLGGIPTTDGRHVRSGQLYRSEALLNLGSEDQNAIRAIGLKLVCDLRSDIERAAQPCMQWLNPAPRFASFDVAAQLTAQTAPLMERMRSAPGPDCALEMMMRTYQTLPRAAAGALRAMMAALLDGDTPMLVHCSAGKDRTGFVCAALLAALGVSRDRIMEDYLHTGPAGHAAHAARTAQMMSLFLGKPLDAESLAVLSINRPAFLAASFTALERQWGSVDHYLADAAGLDSIRRGALQALLVE